ncbi:MAG: hypothetical protein U9Q68_00265 [Euryarchaeota archaeon]|nr:hypothetical protein [Euryarchaeota archaeon]
MVDTAPTPSPENASVRDVFDGIEPDAGNELFASHLTISGRSRDRSYRRGICCIYPVE